MDASVGEEMAGVPTWKLWRRRRYVVALFTFLGFFSLYTLRVNVSVVIVDMTANKTHVLDNGTTVYGPDFAWDAALQGVVLSAFFYGYACTQLLGGWLALRVGGLVLLAAAVGVSALLALLTPWLAVFSAYAFIAIRAIQGLVQGVSYPAALELWSHWAPPRERSVLTNVGYAGCDMGAIVAMTTSGILTADLGWPTTFYVFGGMGMAWTVLWLLVVRRSPANDRCIDPRERIYIEESLGALSQDQQSQQYPWKSLLTSMPVWAVLVANFTANWGYYMLLTELPTFMKETLHYSIEESGIMSALPSVLVVIILPLAGLLADWLINRELLTISQVRKVFCCGSFMVQAVFMLVVAFVMTPAVAVASITVSTGVSSFAYASFFVNSLDIAPQYASIIVGLSNTLGSVPGIVTPILVGYIAPNRVESEWQLVFIITSAIYIVGTICYGIFASGDQQHWAKQEQKLKREGTV